MYHDIPCIGLINHGYYCYTPLFFRELAKANDYEIIDLFLFGAGSPEWLENAIEIRDDEDNLLIGPSENRENNQRYCLLVSFTIRAVLKKTKSAPFRMGLDIATAHNIGDPAALKTYLK